MIARLVDTVLDRTVVPGYTRAGFRVRRRMWPAGDPRPDALRGKTALVTGGASGIGLAAAAGLARLGADVHLLVRNPAKAPAGMNAWQCDVADLDGLHTVAAQLLASLDRVDVLVHNAGVLPAERSETPDGHELTLATHVLGPLLLTELLRPAMHQGRVVFVSSGGMYTQRLPARDPEYRDGRYRGASAYARSKRIQVALTPCLARHLEPDGISVYAMHPGWTSTPGLTRSLPGFARLTAPLLRSADEGADTIVWLAATEPAPAGGGFWHDRRRRPTHLVPGTGDSKDDLARVWQYCRQTAGLEP